MGELGLDFPRMAWHVPQPKDPEYRKNIDVGMEGTVEGFADKDRRQVLLNIIVSAKGKNLPAIRACNPSNLTRASDWVFLNPKAVAAAAKAAAAAGPQPELATGKKDKKAPSWALQASLPEDVKIESGWSKDLLSDANDLLKIKFLEGRVSVGLEQLSQALPAYNDKDLSVVLRKNDKGVWCSELWTARAFEAEDLILGPLSSQLKDTHLMSAQHAVVGLPRHGQGAHPKSISLALDGRMRTMIARKNTVDDEDHKGILFFLVGRTSKVSDANLTFEQTHMEMTVGITLPTKNKREKTNTVIPKSSTSWSSADLPGIPVLINHKAIEAHTRLLAFQTEKKK